MLKSLVRSAYFASQIPSWARFHYKLKHPVQAQERLLSSYCQNFQDLQSVRTINEFQSRIPLSDYSDWQEKIDLARLKGDGLWKGQALLRFEPTSGSTFRRKFIPYTQLFTTELERVLSVWMADLAIQNPSVALGSQYWSLSWAPASLRAEHLAPIQDDSQLFSSYQQFFLKKIFAVDPATALADTEERWLISTLVQLCSARDLGFISIWSPTFLLSLIEGIESHRSRICALVKDRSTQMILESSLTGAELTRALWPKLWQISCWTSSTSRHFLPQLRAMFGDVVISAKGLWATEGVISFAFQGKHPLAIESHFFEFKEPNSEKIYLVQDLQLGQVVEPIISTGTGLWRYRMGDLLRVKGFVGNQVPDLEFLGRLHTCDLVGEKLGASELSHILQECQTRHSPSVLGWFAILPNTPRSKPYYALIAPLGFQLNRECAAQAEHSLMQWHHYQVARSLNQLESVRVLLTEDPFKLLRLAGARMSKGSAGQTKVEAVIVMSENEFNEIRSS